MMFRFRLNSCRTSWTRRATQGFRSRCLHSSLPCRDRANPLEEAAKLVIGTKLHGYTVESVTPIPDFDLTAVQLTHGQTGAQHLHIARKDSNNVFSVGFRTTPMDSTGVPHILEHTTLCGSQRYPVRDPFFKMLTRSLSTFMNAFTANDWTMYPFSSQNTQDFQNLLSVYLDCVFFPRLRELDFRQEGWRLEHKDPRDPSSEIIFKGIVFNEMKGYFANSESIFAQSLQNKLHPSHTYSNVSGGWPLSIPDLTWEALKEFHGKHYHPSNSRFFTYGDMPLSQHLEQIEHKALSRFGRSTPSLEVPLEPRWKEPREHHIHCGVDPMAADPKKQTTASISFLLAPITDPYESLVVSILSNLLVDGPASPFYQALLDANIGSDFSPMTGYDSSTREASFSVGLQGIQEEDVPQVKEIIWSTLKRVASEGFPEERIKAVLHQIELGLKHQSSSFGLSLISSVISPWIHAGDPAAMLQVNHNVEKFKEDLKSPTFLQDKLREYFLENSHHMTLVMTPDEQYEHQLLEAEQEKLGRMVSSLSEEQRSHVYQQGLQLLEDQERLGGEDCLPTLLVSDVERKIQFTQLEHDYAGGVPVQYAEQPTNGVTYFRAISGISLLPDDMMIYVPLFCAIITQMGAGELDHRQFAQQCDLYTGGLHVSPHVTQHHTNLCGYDQGVLFSSHCLDRHLPYLLALWEDVFTSPNLQDQERLRTLVNMAASNMAMNIANAGHNFAMAASASHLSPAAHLSELFGGITQVEFLKQIAESEDLSEVLQKLGSIAAEILDCGSLRCAINTSAGNMDPVVNAIGGFIDTLPGSRADLPSYTEDAEFQSKGTGNVYYQMPFPVHYVGQSLRTVPFTHEDSPRLRLLARLLSAKFLHREIREKGGAYGSGAKQGDGIFSLFSYRDPNSIATLGVFQDSIDWAMRGDFTDRDVDEAKLSVFSQVDAPVSPGSKGSTFFVRGISDDLRQSYRERLFDVGRKDLIDVAKRYLQDSGRRSSAIVGPESSSVSSNSEWTVKTFSL